MISLRGLLRAMCLLTAWFILETFRRLRFASPGSGSSDGSLLFACFRFLVYVQAGIAVLNRFSLCDYVPSLFVNSVQ